MTRLKMTALTVGIAGLVGVALADPPENPFEGSWSGIYEVAEFGVVGIVDFDVSKTGVLRGTAFNEEGGYGRGLVASLKADGSIRGAGFPLTPDTVGEPYSGQCSIHGDGSMVCDLIGCVLHDCFDLLVTVAPVVEGNAAIAPDEQESDIALGAAQGATAGLSTCGSVSYEGTTGGGGRTRSIARQEALEFATAWCNGTCGSEDGCSANKPICKGTVKLHDTVCEGPTTLGSVYCSGPYTCTCSCSRNP